METKEKRNYKDSVFTMLFGEQEAAVELFNALNGTDYAPDTEVKFTTLDDVLYHGKKNDLGFIIDNQYIVLSEHQSTICENMPLRQLQYISRSYERQVDSTSLYGSKLVKIPMPEFYVIYTGQQKWDKEYLKLSDAFAEEDQPVNSMELMVKIIKIGYNENNEVLKRSSRLKGYSLLLKYIRDFIKEGYAKREAINLAVRKCLDENILKDFLKTHSSEVGSMLYDDITMEEFIELRAAERAEDLAQDIAKDIAKDMAEVLAKQKAEDMAKDMAEVLAKQKAQDMAKDMAKKFKDKGMDSETIAECTGLSLADIEVL